MVCGGFPEVQGVDTATHHSLLRDYVDVALMRDVMANLGHALETVILVELERRRMEVNYVRTPSGYEVDFLARRPGERPELIQVCTDLGTPEVAEREIRALEDVAKVFPKGTRRLLTITRDAMPSDVPQNVVVQPAYEWLLS